MGKLDPQLESMRRGSAGRDAPTSSSHSSEVCAVFLRYSGELAPIEALGFKARTVNGDIATGTLPLARLDEIAALPQVRKLEVGGPVKPQLDVGTVDVGAQEAWDLGYRGKGVIVGIIDFGIDFTHPSFIREDGTTRFISIWEQDLVPNDGERHPRNPQERYRDLFDYGVEYEAADIQAALAPDVADPFALVRTREVSGEDGVNHGTHCTGIAAGNGRGSPSGTRYAGVAPEAGIIFVTLRRRRRRYTETPEGAIDGEEVGLRVPSSGDLIALHEAIEYIQARARALYRPVAINMSLSSSLGPHDGTSMLEQLIDRGADEPGRAIVVAAGNDARASKHIRRQLTSASPNAALRVDTRPGCEETISIDIWYEGIDALDLTLLTPSGGSHGPYHPGDTVTGVALEDGDRLRLLDSAAEPDEDNGAKRIYLELEPGSQTNPDGSPGPVELSTTGDWTISLTGTGVTSGLVDAWIERDLGDPKPTFRGATQEVTVGVPATAGSIVSVANYRDRDGVPAAVNPAGSIWGRSAHGPTRDGRLKPDVAAPGQGTLAPALGASYTSAGGTSAAAPYVTGVAALMLDKTPNLTQREIRDCLVATAREDGDTGRTPNIVWGFGKVDARAAVLCARAALEPERRSSFRLLPLLASGWLVLLGLFAVLPVGPVWLACGPSVPDTVCWYGSWVLGGLTILLGAYALFRHWQVSSGSRPGKGDG